MSFDDDFTFPEAQSMTSVAKQIGNAVPPRLAQAVAEQLAVELDRARAVRSTARSHLDRALPTAA